MAAAADASGSPEIERQRRQESLDALAREVATCTRCAGLQGRTQTVFGVGNPLSPLVFMGEAPGEEEDKQGIPFVGRAGKKLTEIIEGGITKATRDLLGDVSVPAITREDVYICNVLKCRPPGNRNPEPQEMTNCKPFLSDQLAILKPQVIVALGAFAAKWLLDTTEAIGRLRGRVHRFQDIPVVVTYHPAYLLRSYTPENRRKVMDDIVLAVRTLHDMQLVPWW